MRIVDPTHGTPVDDPAPAAPSSDPAGRRELCLFSNNKPGAAELLRGVAERLGAERGLGDTGELSKPNAAAGAEPALLDHLASQYRMAVVAIGD